MPNVYFTYSRKERYFLYAHLEQIPAVGEVIHLCTPSEDGAFLEVVEVIHSVGFAGGGRVFCVVKPKGDKV